MNRFTFDVETRPSPDALTRFAPTFEPVNIPPEPKPDSRLKDPEKIAANAELVRVKSMERGEAIAQSIADQREKWIADGALRAERGEVLAIGWKDDAFIQGIQVIHGQENHVLEEFVSVLRGAIKDGRTICGFNIIGFDLPFIRRRCIILGIPFPFYNRADKWKPWAFPVYDAMVDWQCGNYRDYISLDAMSRGLGGSGKEGSGADFAKLYETDRESALDYLRNDVEQTDFVCGRLLA